MIEADHYEGWYHEAHAADNEFQPICAFGIFDQDGQCFKDSLCGVVGHNQHKIPLYARLPLNNHSFSFVIDRSTVESMNVDVIEML